MSQWGHDFRPDYKNLRVLKENFPEVPLMALTATATERVLGDVQTNLCMQNPVIFRQSFNRENLRYPAIFMPVPYFSMIVSRYELRKKSKKALDEIAKWINQNYRNESGIVYCLSQKECEEVAKDLKVKNSTFYVLKIVFQEQGVSAHHYHAAMDVNERTLTQKRWTTDKIKVIVATIAFGMGINKPDVRYFLLLN